MNDAYAPYPGWNVLAKWDSQSFNHQTRAVLHRRLTEIPERRFFSATEWQVLEALCDTVMPQDGARTPVPLAAWIDAAQHEGRSNGTRFAEMPPDRDAWRQGLAALNAEAQLRNGSDFAALDAEARAALLHDVDAGRVEAAEWVGLPPQLFFRHLVLSEIVGIHYSHPTGQSEIGFGGPASPRGYVRLDAGRADSWEAPPGDWRGLEP